MTDTDSTYDPMVLAAQDLADHLVPEPEDLYEGLGPLGALLLLERSAYECLSTWAREMSGEHGLGLGDGDELGQAVQGLTTAVGMIDGACVAVGLLPPEATEVPS